MGRLVDVVPYVLLATAAGTVWLASFFLRERRKPGALWFSAALLSCGVWTCLDATSYLASAEWTRDVARRLVWPVVMVASVSFFRFACAYSRRPAWWRAVRVPVFAAFALLLALMVTNPWHSAVWGETEWIDAGWTRLPELTPGPAFYWLHMPFNYGLIVGGIVALLADALDSRVFYLRRALVFGLGMTAPLVVNLVVVSRVTRGIDLTPIALIASFAAIAWVTLRERLLDVMPAVRSLLFRQHHDGVVVLDAESRVIDWNSSVRDLFGGGEALLGIPAGELIPFWDQVREVVQAGDGRTREVAHRELVIEIRSLLIRDDKERTVGRLVVFHDVTEQSRLIRELNAYARTVAHDLKNPLAAAIGCVDLVRAEPGLSESSVRVLDDAEETCLKMARIIDELLRRAARRARAA